MVSVARTNYYQWEKPNDGDGRKNGQPWGDKIRLFMDDVDSLLHYNANPMHYAGDIIIAGTAGASGRLGIGTAGQVLTVIDGVTLNWTSLIPTMFGNSGKILTNNGTITQWQNFYSLAAMSGLTQNKILSNDGTNSVWITNTNPPSVTGQASKYLSNDATNLLWNTIATVPSTAGHAGHMLVNDGSSYYWTATSYVYPTQTAQAGKFLSTNGLVISWQDPPSGFSNPMTTYADLIVGYTGGNAVKLAPGTDGYFLSVTSAYDAVVSATVKKLQWLPALTNPMTTLGDIMYASSGGAATRLALGGVGSLLVTNSSNPYWLGLGANQTVLVSNGSNPFWMAMTIVPAVSGHAGSWLYTDGSSAYWSTFVTIPSQSTHNGQYLTTDGSNVSWANIPAGFANPMTSVGDLIVATTGGAAARLPIGTNNYVLTMVSGTPQWAINVTGLPTMAGQTGRFLHNNGTVADWQQIYQVPTVVGQTGLFLGNDGSNYTWMAVPNLIPNMTGQTGKYLTNDGTNASWVPYNGLPSLTGNSGKILQTDGVTSFWVTPSASGGSLTRLPITVTSTSLAVLALETKTVDTTCKSFQIQTISADTPCRIRFYGTAAAAAADYYRSASIDPIGNHGMFAEIILTQANPSWILSPVVTCDNQDTITNTNIYITITNNGSSTRAIVINLGLLKME